MKYLTSKQMAGVDKLAMRSFGLSAEQMMENAGRGVANFVAKLNPREVAVIYGKGNNGGDGLVAARHLSIKGVKVFIVPASKELSSLTLKQFKILKKMGIKPIDKIPKCDVIIDSLLGYNLKGAPKLRYAELIFKANNMKKKGTIIVSVDIPSGMHCDSGERKSPCINPDYILTLGLPKIGLKKAGLKNIYLVNLGVPNKVYSKIGIRVKNYFRKGDIVLIS